MHFSHRHIPRLYVASITEQFNLNAMQTNHLVSVFRLRVGDKFIAFNPKDGEWECKLNSISKKLVTANRISLIKLYQSRNKLYIAFGIIKPDNIKLIIEKCTELGTTEFFPLIAEYTQYKNINIEKLQTIAIQAVEQSEHMELPVIHTPMHLTDFVKQLPDDVVWMTALERSHYAKAEYSGNAGFIIGPEGGFSNEECNLLASKTQPISLGEYILRTETACIACACLNLEKSS